MSETEYDEDEWQQETKIAVYDRKRKRCRRRENEVTEVTESEAGEATRSTRRRERTFANIATIATAKPSAARRLCCPLPLQSG